MEVQDNPIIYSPYDKPTLHYQNIVKRRWIYDLSTNAPIPVRKGCQQQIFDTGNHIINILRIEVEQWRIDKFNNLRESSNHN